LVNSRFAASGTRSAANGLGAIARDNYAGPDAAKAFAMPARTENAGTELSSERIAFDPWPMEKEVRPMKTLAALVLFACMNAGVVWGASAQTPEDSSAVDAVKQVGQDMGEAMIAVDIDKLDRIFADDWVTVGMSGKVSTKEMLLKDVKDDKKRLTWFELRPMDVQVFGDVAIVQGNVAEKRMVGGKETEMELVYSDILNKREGRWVVVRSIGAPIK
jgi:ketosteroid isomerase-like protein